MEDELARFTGWHRKTNVALEYWQVIVTSRRLICCFLGQSFQSLLLKADMGASHREDVASMSPAEAAAFDEKNLLVPLSSLQAITLTSSTRFRTAALEFEWADDRIQFRRNGGEDAEATLSSLERDDRLEHVTIEIRSPSLLPWR